jgi:ABC-2 type transport system permease protein
MKKALSVARWEFSEKVKSKAFLFSLLFTPMIMIASGVLPTLLAGRPDASSKVIAVIDLSGQMFTALDKRVSEHYRLPTGIPNYVLEQYPTVGGLEGSRSLADSLVVGEAVEGCLIITKDALADSGVEYRSQNVGNIRILERFTTTLRDIIVEKKLEAHGIDAKIANELTSHLEIQTVKLTKSGEARSSGINQVFLSAYLFMMMMFILVVTSGQLLVRSMLEEKSNRVIEVLLSSASANDLMAGKILGLSALGLTQIGIWTLIGFAISLNFSITLIAPANGLVLLLYFIVGYVLYAAIFVAAGAPVSTEQEAQQITSYFVIILTIPIILAVMVIQDPNSLLVRVLSYIPILTPMMMAIRIPLQMPPPGEIAATLLIVAMSAVAAVWVAGKIFRTTILMYGKRPSLRELVALVKIK